MILCGFLCHAPKEKEVNAEGSACCAVEESVALPCFVNRLPSSAASETSPFRFGTLLQSPQKASVTGATEPPTPYSTDYVTILIVTLKPYLFPTPLQDTLHVQPSTQVSLVCLSHNIPRIKAKEKKSHE